MARSPKPELLAEKLTTARVLRNWKGAAGKLLVVAVVALLLLCYTMGSRQDKLERSRYTSTHTKGGDPADDRSSHRKVAILVGGLMVGSNIDLFRNNMEFLVKPQIEAGLTVDIFMILAKNGPSNQSAFDEFRAVAIQAGSRVAELFPLDESGFSLDDKHQTGKWQISVHERSSITKVVRQNKMIKIKLQRAEKFERENGFLYDWFVHVRADAIWFDHVPAFTMLDKEAIHVPDFGAYGGFNDRFSVVPRVHRRAFFYDRVDRFFTGEFEWNCAGVCPCNGICMDHCAANQLSMQIHNNECLLRSMLTLPGAQSMLPVVEQRFAFNVAKNYGKKLCIVYWDECFKFGKKMCNCINHRCATDKIANDKEHLAAIRNGSLEAGHKGSTGFSQDLSIFERTLSPDQYDQCYEFVHELMEGRGFHGTLGRRQLAGSNADDVVSATTIYD